MTLFLKQNSSNKIADRLDLVGSKVASALSDRIRLCNQNWNLCEGQGLVNGKTGATFNGRVLLWNCKCRLCGFCVSSISTRNRKISNYIIENEPKKTYLFRNNPKTKYQWRFVVLTMPDDALIGLSLFHQREVFYHAWRLFSTKSEYFKEVVSGGVKTEEFTFDSAPNPYHYHGNLLLYCQFLNQEQFKKDWTKAVKASFKHFGLDWQCRTGYNKFILSLYCFLYSKPSMDLFKLVCLRAKMCGLVNVYLKQVVDQRVNEENSTLISTQNAVKYLCKYVTKSQTWEDIPLSDLREIVENRRFWRMFEVFGSCRETAKPLRSKAVKATPKPVVIVNPRAGEIISLLSNGAFYVHSPTINATNPAFVPANPAHAPPNKPKKKSWFYRISNNLITNEKYRNELINNFIHIRQFRIKQLRSLYPTAKFRMLDGAKFHGESCVCGACPLGY